MTITFLLNGESVQLASVTPTETFLDFLRETRGLTGTKEGCNEGDCGACTVMVSDETGTKALNACILFLPQLHGKVVRTVEGLAAPDGTLHPVQEAMIAHHGSQCGFCTPGIVMSLAVAHLKGDAADDDVLAGNLCRCTGYAPIIRAAQAARDLPPPDWLSAECDAQPLAPVAEAGDQPRADWFAPDNSDALATLYAANPKAQLIAGATDVGLWVTKQLRDLGPVIFLNRATDLAQIEQTEAGLRLGAMVTMDRLREAVSKSHPSFAEMLRRFASTQVRAAATLGGNIANGSPIGDSPPALIALGATLHLRQGERRRSLPLEDFFLEYGKQDRAEGEFVEALTLPDQPDRLKVYKLSKRFDQDISAVLGAFAITVQEGVITKARIAFGGMAGVPKRASFVEQALIGAPWKEESLSLADAAWTKDFTPMSDMRASSEYRLAAARNMLRRYWFEDQGLPVSVLEVRA